MNCQEVMELMQRHLDEDLNTQEEMELQDHLRHCQECTEMFERLQRLSQELTQLPKVVPPYSLVDALIPQLDEIDKSTAQSTSESLTTHGTTQQHSVNKDEGQRPHRKWTRRLESQFSWKFASGVIAAGLIIGFFAFNMKHPVLDNADGLLPPKASQEIASGSAAQQRTAADAAGAANSKRMAPGDSPQASAAVTAPSADLQQPATQPADGGSAQSQSPSQAASDATLEKPQPLKGADAGTPTPKMAPSTSEPARMKSPGASEKAATESVPAPTAPTAPSPTPEPQVSEPPQGARIQATEPPPASSPVAGPKEPRAKAPNTNGVFSLMTQSPAPLKSLTGTYEAMIENHHVVIRNSTSQEVVYTSTYQGEESDEITLGEWSKDDKLTYQVKASGTAKSIVIDVKTKTESST
ncbi:anti-sigma factor family protein [Paenibacillus aestuarii]|uniref:Anti-sigma-W factor RsiW n=1 Tax=Paenibacillus aestuarii TaxID=516965 RepID=A0ABW0KC56_9BACL|nr:zf-HC2 domain-containing protein [Paenibacillus aestuarii]